jgi:ubiquinone/menaquinone biosynthesis C-methylase UbiE
MRLKKIECNAFSSNKISEQKAAEAFTRQSSIFDEIYSTNAIIQYKRDRVRKHAENFLKPGSNILELNAGTGEDAIYFAQKGHHVHATDISEGMQTELKKKRDSAALHSSISTEICSFTELGNLKNKGPYDFIFSNFAGLNCTNELDKVLLSFNSLLKPGGAITLVVMPGFCLWETMLALKGQFKTAFRRFNSKNGVCAHIEGVYFTCWYYTPSYIKKILKNDFKLISVEGLCSIVPPSYMENFPKKHPKLFKWLSKKEEKYKGKFPWKNIGDYFIISFQKPAA